MQHVGRAAPSASQAFVGRVGGRLLVDADGAALAEWALPTAVIALVAVASAIDTGTRLLARDRRDRGLALTRRP